MFAKVVGPPFKVTAPLKSVLFPSSDRLPGPAVVSVAPPVITPLRVMLSSEAPDEMEVFEVSVIGAEISWLPSLLVMPDGFDALSRMRDPPEPWAMV